MDAVRSALADLAGAVEVSEGRTATAVAVAGYLGDQLRVDLVAVLDGAGTAAVAEVERLTSRYQVGQWAVDPASPAGSLLLPLAALGVTLLQPSARDLAGACGAFLDMTRDGSVKAARSKPLRDSVRAAQARRTAGGMAWDRRDAETAPLLAASLAIWACVNYSGLAPDQVYIGGAEPAPRQFLTEPTTTSWPFLNER